MAKLVIDMMGSDLGVNMAKEGVRLFLAEHPEAKLLLVGKKEELSDMKDVEILDAQDVLPMDAGPLDVMRKKESSMTKAVFAVKERGYQGVVSAGGTGAFLSSASLILKKAPGVLRPALAACFPNFKKNSHVVVLDIGANNENSPEEMAQFALMGAIYQKVAYKVNLPKVGLLSNGAEDGKGSPEGKATFALLKKEVSPYYSFIGNVEGKDILEGEADVVVTDGFSGNILLKSTEGAAKAMGHLLKKAFLSSFSSKLGYLFAKKGISSLKSQMDPGAIGGALLLGVNSIAVKAHGASDAYAFKNAIALASSLADGKALEEIIKGLQHAE